MGADSGPTGTRRSRAGTHRRAGQSLILRRDHSGPQRSRRRSFPAPSPSALAGLAVLVLIAVGVVHLSGSGTAVPLEPAPSMSASSDTATEFPAEPPPAAGTGPAPAEQSPGGAQSLIIVHVSGAVRAPGVVRLSGDVRVGDALEAAGGPTEEADLSAVNLARPLSDGEQIHVPVPGEEPRALPSAPAAGSGGESPAEGAPIDLNTAAAAELEELPGVGPAIAQRIIEHREKNGSFSSVDDLLEVSGIGPATLEEIRGRATV